MPIIKFSKFYVENTLTHTVNSKKNQATKQWGSSSERCICQVYEWLCDSVSWRILAVTKHRTGSTDCTGSKLPQIRHQRKR